MYVPNASRSESRVRHQRPDSSGHGSTGLKMWGPAGPKRVSLVGLVAVDSSGRTFGTADDEN